MTKLEYWLAAGKGANQVAIQEVIEGRAAIVPFLPGEKLKREHKEAWLEEVLALRIDTPVSQ